MCTIIIQEGGIDQEVTPQLIVQGPNLVAE